MLPFGFNNTVAIFATVKFITGRESAARVNSRHPLRLGAAFLLTERLSVSILAQCSPEHPPVNLLRSESLRVAGGRTRRPGTPAGCRLVERLLTSASLG